MSTLDPYSGDALDQSAFPSLWDDKINACSTCIVFQLAEGHNAWNSTFPSWLGNFHTSLQSARSDAESSRRRGTVFFIREIPALRFHGENGSLLMSESGSRSPLDRISERVEVPNFSRGVLFRDLAREITSKCRTWNGGKSKIVLVASDNPKDIFAELPKGLLREYHSKAVGGDVSLDWIDIESRTEVTGVQKLYVLIRAHSGGHFE